MKRINVLVVSSKYYTEYAGSGVRARTTYKRLSEKYPIDFEVLTGSVTYSCGKVYSVDGHRVRRIAMKPFPVAADERRDADRQGLIQKLKHGCNYIPEAVLTWSFLAPRIRQFDIIHVFGKNWVTSAAITFAKVVRKPFIIELCNEVYTPHHYEPRLLSALLGKGFPVDTPIVCISEMLREVCLRHGYEKSVWCRPNPVDERRFYADKEGKAALRQRYTKFTADDILMIYLAKFRPSKNQIFLLDVLRYLPDRFKLVLAGPIVESGPLSERDRDYLKSIKEKISELRLEERVQLDVRFIDDAAGYFRMSDVCVFPSATEALGTPILESISCGIPVVAHRIPKVTDLWIEDGKNGYLSALQPREFAEKVEKAIAIGAQTFMDKRREIVSYCSADRIDSKYFDLIQKGASGASR